MNARQKFLLNPVRKESYGEIEKENPDVLILCPHDANSEKFLEVYPELLEPFSEFPNLLQDFFQLERDIGSYQLSHQTTKELLKLSKGELRIDLLSIPEIPRAVIDANRIPLKQDSIFNPSGVHTNPIRKIFDHDKYPNLLEEFNNIHRKIICEFRRALSTLLDDGIFFDIHCMNDHDPIKTDIPIKEGPNPTQLQQYIRRLTIPDFQGRQRSVNLLTKFVDQPIIANEDLVQNIEGALQSNSIQTERDHPYSYLDFSMCSHYALENKNKGTTIDFPIRVISKDNKSDNLNPELDNLKIKKISNIIASAIHQTIKKS